MNATHQGSFPVVTGILRFVWLLWAVSVICQLFSCVDWWLALSILVMPSAALILFPILRRALNPGLAAQWKRSARKIHVAANASQQLSAASIELSNEALAYFQVAQQSYCCGKPVQFLCCHLYGKLLLARSSWFLGRSMLLLERAEAEIAKNSRLRKRLRIEP